MAQSAVSAGPEGRRVRAIPGGERSVLPEPATADPDAVLAQCLKANARQAAPSSPASLAEAIAVLWRHAWKHDTADPQWPDRDRVVVAPDRFVALLDSLQALAEGELHSAVGAGTSLAAEIATEPLGIAVGLALAERLLAARFGRSLVDHRTWALVCDRELIRGLSHEAASLAGQWRLDKLTVLWDDAADERGSSSPTAEVLRRFVAYGWTVLAVQATDTAAIAAALGKALRARKPTLIACQGAGGAGSAAGRPPPEDAPFAPARDVRAAFGGRAAASRRSWLKRYVRHPLRSEFERVLAGRLGEPVPDRLADTAAIEDPAAANAAIVSAMLGAMPDVIIASATPALPATGRPNAPRVLASSMQRRYLDFGLRARGLATAVEGLARHGGLLPVASARLADADAMMPAIRAASRGGLRIVMTLACAADDRATEAERVAALRIVPNLLVVTPADGVEMVDAWTLALRRTAGPTVIVVGGRPVTALPAPRRRPAHGAYVIAEADGPRHATLLATGAEVAVALAVRALLAAERIAVAVVSMPCWPLFAQADAAYQTAVLGDAPRFAIDWGSGLGWDRWLGSGEFIALDGLGPHKQADWVAARLRQISPAVRAMTGP